MFKRKEESEEQKRQKEERQRKIDLLSINYEKLSAEYQHDMEEFKISVSPKWEYMQISTKDKNVLSRISELGRVGWEMVGVTTFTEGATFGGAGSYTVQTLYVFKRQLPKFPQEFSERYSALMKIRKQIDDLRNS